MVNTAEQDILEQIKNGSDGAFKEVYKHNRELFINFGRKYNVGDDDLLDIYQDSCIALYDNVVNGKLVNLTSSLSTYLLSIGKYKILEKLRNEKRTVNSEQVISNVSAVDNEVYELSLENEGMTPNEKLLAKCFSKLGEKCKEIIKLYYYRGFKIQEIMTIGNYSSENVVKSQKSRCLRQLRDCVKN